jgi:hypothetical protein
VAVRTEVAEERHPAVVDSRSVGAGDRPCLEEDLVECAFDHMARFGRVALGHVDRPVADALLQPCVVPPPPSSLPSIPCGSL